MKSIALLLLILTTTTAQADSRWWRDDGRRVEAYEHKVHHAHKKHQKQKHKHEQKHKQQHRRDHIQNGSELFRKDYNRNKGHHDYRPRRWEPVQSFRGRSGKDVKRYIEVQDRVHALSIQGTKRAMYIREAYALMGNGRWVRVKGLEGYVRRGERLKHRLRNPRFIQRIVLEVEPARYKRGYAELSVRPA